MSSDRPSGWAIRFLTLVYPRRLRREYGEEIGDFIVGRVRGARGPWAVLGVFWVALRDLAVTWRAEMRRSSIGTRPQRTEAKLESIAQDLRYAFRRLVRTPAFSLGALAIMAVAIGANAAVFAVVDRMLFRPPPFGEPDQVVRIYQDSDDGQPSSNTFPAYRDMSELTVFQSVGATSPASATLEGDGGQVPVRIEFTTSSFLAAIGREPMRGRWFEPAMDLVGAGNYAVVSHNTWMAKYGGDASIVGRTIRLNRQPVTVIGVGPEGFNGAGGFTVTDFWLSISSVAIAGDFRVANLERRQDHWYAVVARLSPGATVEQAQQAVDALALRLAEVYPELNEGRGITVFPAREIRLEPGSDGMLYSMAGILVAVVFLILILASTNIGSLLLVRGLTRGPELAVRRVLGAGSGRVARLFLIEAFLLSATGGLAGLVLARWIVGSLALMPVPAQFAGTLDFSVDGRVLLFCLLLVMASGLFFGMAPALQSLRGDLAGVLRTDRHGGGGRGRLGRFRNVLVGIQVAVSLILVVGAGMMVKSLVASQGVNTGVDVERVAFVQTAFTEAGIAPAARAPVLSELETRLSAVPGVATVAIASRLPVQAGGTTTTVVEGYEPTSGTGSVELPWVLVSPGYFQTLGIRLVHGRTYTAADRVGSDRLVIVNETAARRFWGTPDAVGRRIRPQGNPEGWIQVAGVVADTKVASLGEPATPLLYFVMGESGVDSPYFLVRTGMDPAALLPQLRQALVAVDNRLPEVGLGTLESHMGDVLATARVSAGVFSVFSLLALLLASVGIYTIVSFSVAARMPEIGLRVALGAARLRVVRMVVSDIALTAGLGLLGGMIVVGAANYAARYLLPGVNLLDARVLSPSILILIGAVGIASYLPARRAAGADPVQALKRG